MKKVIHWFRQDLRLSDNPSFAQAAKDGVVLPLYIFDVINNQEKPLGAASRCWLHNALADLSQQLDHKLIIEQGDPLPIILKLIKMYQIKAVYWNRGYEPWHIKRDTRIKSELQALGVTVNSYNGFLLWEPWEITKKDGGHYKVFTPFYRKGCLGAMPPRKPIAKPSKIDLFGKSCTESPVNTLHLLPKREWGTNMLSHWSIGEQAAQKQLKAFIQQGLDNYKEGRNFPALQNVSRLSPHLHWGEISPQQIWYAIKQLPQNANADCFLSELGWREFSYSLLYYYPSLPWENLQAKFNAFPWRKNKKLLSAWQRGLTGYPIVDAGMRELWQTGYMHNRVRMIVASFLVKNLLIHWREGEQWFWDCLVDADLASNSTSWQWVAGCGADAAPFFRIFNPVLQGKKFDPDGNYTRQYAPELKNLPNKYLFSPWEAPDDVLKTANIKLGKNYPKPIVDLAFSRTRALETYKSLK